jgi:alcohol dehydrogenase
LIEQLEQWTESLQLPRLSAYGIGEGDIPAIVSGSRNNSMKTNPVRLDDEEIGEIVRRRL